jgi:hypothetical protein
MSRHASRRGDERSAVKRVAEMVTQDYVTNFAMQAAEATNSSAVNGLAEVVAQEYITHFDIQAAEATNTPAIFGRWHDKSRFRKRRGCWGRVDGGFGSLAATR